VPLAAQQLTIAATGSEIIRRDRLQQASRSDEQRMTISYILKWRLRIQINTGQFCNAVGALDWYNRSSLLLKLRSRSYP
jgi:hypothetical protein